MLLHARHARTLAAPAAVAAALLILAAAITLAATPVFVPNQGQIVDDRGNKRPDILATARMSGGILYLRASGVSYVIHRVETTTTATANAMLDRWRGGLPDTGTTISQWRADVEFVGANPSPRVEMLDTTAAISNYYLSQCPGGITGVRSFRRMVYHEIYPNIDLVYHAGSGGIKYDFIVRPGGRVTDIVLRYVGAGQVHIRADGSLEATTPLGTVGDGRPESYTTTEGGTRQGVRVRYSLADTTVRFVAERYNTSRTLTIDPTLLWSTYYGGSDEELNTWGAGGSILDRPCASDGDSLGTMCFNTYSTDFPTTPGVLQRVYGGGQFDVGVFQFTHRGTLRWSTYFGGPNEDGGAGVCMDHAGNTYVVGSTGSPNLPTTAGAFNTTYAPAADGRVGFMLHLDNAGRLSACGYMNGGSVQSVMVNPAGNVVMAGTAGPGVAATPGVFQTTPPTAGHIRPFIATFTPTFARRWLTFCGGTGVANSSTFEFYAEIAVAASGNIYACGVTEATDFPITGTAFQPALRGISDCWLARLDSAGGVHWSTYLGGIDREFGISVAVDRQENIAIAGTTQSTDFPVSNNAFQPIMQPGGGHDLFIGMFDSAGHHMWSTFYGGHNHEIGGRIDVDDNGSIWIAGQSWSADMPLTDTSKRVTEPDADGLLLKFDSSGRRLHAWLLGGGDFDNVGAVAATHSGVFVAGSTLSTDFPTRNPVQATKNARYDAFAAFYCDMPRRLDAHNASLRFCAGDSIVLTAPPFMDRYRWSTGATTQSITVRASGTYYATIDAGACSSTTDTIRVVVFPTPTRPLRPSGTYAMCQGDSVNISVAGGIRAYRWSTGDTMASITVARAGKYSLAFTDTNGCTNRSDTLTVVVHPLPTCSVTPLGPLAFCDGASVSLDAGNGFNAYLWSTGATSQRITVNKPGVYTARVQSADGCWSPLSEPVTVRVFANPTVAIRNLLPTTFCDGDSTILAASPARFVRYEWSNGAGTPFIAARAPGTYTLTVTDSNGCTATARVDVNVKPSPAPALALDGPARFCQGDSVILSVGGFAATQWSTGSTDQRIVVRQSGKYFATVTNEGGCSGTSDTVTIQVMPRPSVAASGPVRVCPNTLAAYSTTPEPRTSYRWSITGTGTITGGANTPTVTIQWDASGGGTLGLTAINDSTGCRADTTIAVVIGSSLQPIVTANRPPRLCDGDSITLDAGAYAAYLWSNGATTRAITVRAPGAYTVTVRDAAGCSGQSDPIVVTFGAPPTPVLAAPNGGHFCDGDSITIDAGPGYTAYRWSNGFLGRVITLRASGTLTLTVTDSNGCTGTSPAITVTAQPLPTPAIVGPRQVCANSTTTYTTTATAGSTYQWAITGGTLVSGQGTASARVRWGAIGAGSVGLAETSAPGCRGASGDVAVVVGDHIVPDVTPAGPVVLCDGASARLDAGDGYASYRWNTGATTRTIDVRAPGAYTVDVVDSGGCSGSSLPVEVITKPAPTPAITALGPLAFCAGDSVALVADAGYLAYLWSTGERTPGIVARTPGTYTVHVTDADGCGGTSPAVTVTVHPLPPKPAVVLAGTQLSTPDAATRYQWLLDGVPIAGQTTANTTAMGDGAYTVTVANAFGCAATSDPVLYHARASARRVWLDTVSARVGERTRLTLRVGPGLAAGDAVHGYHAELRYDPQALFVHDVVSADRTAVGNATVYGIAAPGVLRIDRPATSPALAGTEVARIELEGLVSGQPLNTVTIATMVMPELDTAVIDGVGLLILSGCDIGTAFGKRGALVGITPNPVHEEMAVRYRLPAGHVGVLQLHDAAGRMVQSRLTPAGTGAEQELRMGLATEASGVYVLELLNGAERSALPVVVVR